MSVGKLHEVGVAYQALVARGDSQYGANNLGVFYSSMRDNVKAESLYRMSIGQNPDNMIPVPNLVNTLRREQLEVTSTVRTV